jgi:hypothetical protein
MKIVEFLSLQTEQLNALQELYLGDKTTLVL